MKRLLFTGKLGLAFAIAGCLPNPPATNNPPGFENASDPTNGGATFVGSAACTACHSDVAALHRGHPHANTLQVLDGRAPRLPEELMIELPADAPPNREWTDVAYWVGGIATAARLINGEGFTIVDEMAAEEIIWSPGDLGNGVPAGYRWHAAEGAIEFDFDCFRCHTTGAMNESAFQDSRTGAAGTWTEPGVQCEACHGPGSRHFTVALGEPVVDTSSVFVDSDGSQSCRACHQAGTQLAGRDGFIAPYQQWTELRASGGHADFACTVCHDPHLGLRADRASAIRNECRVCHADTSMAGHGGAMFVRGNISESLSCESCHMPYATKNVLMAAADAAGSAGRIGDVR
ncbi:MAG: multiheme c-type cytochrome, partial [Phycisphaerae bacterium]